MRVYYVKQSDGWSKCGKPCHWLFTRDELTVDQIEIIEHSCSEITRHTPYYLTDAATAEKVLANEYGMGRAQEMKARARKADSPSRFTTRVELDAFLRDRDTVKSGPLVL
jgi:hypothetical protein